jgi:hypothetical protein
MAGARKKHESSALIPFASGAGIEDEKSQFERTPTSTEDKKNRAAEDADSEVAQMFGK